MNKTEALRLLDCGEKYPYDGEFPSKDWAHKAARGILYDLCDRSGIKHAFDGVDKSVRIELVESMSEIIRAALEASQPQEPSPHIATMEQALKDVARDGISITRISFDDFMQPQEHYEEQPDGTVTPVEPIPQELTTRPPESEREEFERMMRNDFSNFPLDYKEYSDAVGDLSYYKHYGTQHMWNGWQAAKQHALTGWKRVPILPTAEMVIALMDFMLCAPKDADDTNIILLALAHAINAAPEAE